MYQPVPSQKRAHYGISDHTPHFGLNFLLRSNICSNMYPCVTAIEKSSSNGWFMRTKLQIVYMYIRLISNLPNNGKISHISALTNNRAQLAIVTTLT